MQKQKMMAVALSVALALMLALTGCGRKPVTNVLLNLLGGQYKNVTVTADKDLENTLRRAVKENGTPEKTAQALEKKLGSTVAFDGLRGGQQGDHAFDLVFQAGKDTDAAARTAFQKWDSVLGTLPANGQYQAGLAMIQADNGCYILVKASVDRAGTTGSTGKGSKGAGQDKGGAVAPGKDQTEKENKDDKQGKEKKENDPLAAIKGVVPMGGSVYVVENQQAFSALMQLDPDLLKDKVIQLNSDAVFTATSQLAQTFKGTLSTNNANKKVEIRNMTNTSLFGKMEGVVRGINVVVPNSLNSSAVGALASENAGLIENCTATINCKFIQGGDQAGGLVGLNRGTIKDCQVKMANGTYMTAANAGGIAGVNAAEGRIQNCTVACEDGKANVYGSEAGGTLVGKNQAGGVVSGSSHQNIGGTKVFIGVDLSAAG